MERMLRNLQTLEDLLKSNCHVVKFQSLRKDQETIPWLLQLSHRETDVWELMHDLCNNTIWTLLGMSVKQHNQVLSKQALQLQATLGKGSTWQSKGRGKTKPPAKQQQRS